MPALIAFGMRGIIGTGIFVCSSGSAAQHAGPAIVFSFIIAGIGCMFAGLCYSGICGHGCQLRAAPTPHATRPGQFVAWFVGWNLIWNTW